ncbi:related to cell polarity protein tea1p [Cephalotrichum gorgonifer]|uniref:Related to cell polarity protein tea1p n=1 Tax=Cephalotrichum gorgonifer TaxID=2041049 RepID=A0AAE8MTL3_9PEZI|nr:related to cell polarity protein tea1p [Cephalotrichum gorgonifer]
MAFLFKSKKQQQEKEKAANRERERDRDSGPGSSGSAQPGRGGSKDEKNSLQHSTPTASLHSLEREVLSGSPDQGYTRRGPSVEPYQQGPVQQQQQPPQQQSDLPFRNGPPVSNVTNPNASLYPWSQRRLLFTSSHPSPFPRYGAAVNSVSSKEGDVYIMGGLINGSTVKGDLWMIEAGGNMACYPLATTAEGPGPRVGHASLLVGNAFIVFGGDTKIEESDLLDETLYLLNTSTRQWSRVLPSGTRPSGRYGHSLNIVGSKIYIYGGQVEGYFMNDLCAFDLNQLQAANNRWEMLIPNGDSGPDPVPQARTNHTMVTYNDKLYLFGGTNGYQWFNDVWCYDPSVNKWSQLDCIGYIPVPREGQAASLVDDVMYIFGGRTEEGNDLGDLAAFRISSRRWYTFQNMGPSPSPRSGHSMTSVGKSVVIVGGEPSSPAGSSTDLGIVYLLDTTKIRYPSDAQGGGSQKSLQGRRPSASEPNQQSAVSRQGPPRESGMSPEGRRPPPNAAGAPTGQMNGNRSPQSGPEVNGRSLRGPTGPPPAGPAPPKPGSSNIPRPRGQSAEREVTANNSQLAGPTAQPPASRDAPKELDSPASNGTRTPTQQQKPSPVRSESGPPETTKGKPKQRSQGSVDNTAEVVARAAPTRPASPPPVTRQLSNNVNRRSSGRNSQTVALLKELDTTRNRNAWYASELELARKQGYSPSANPAFEGRAESFDEEDRPLIEALLAMKTELANVQSSVDKQAIVAAKQIAEAERQRDVAIQEAVYAKAKAAAYAAGGSLGNGQLEGGDQGDDRTGSLSKKLASALSHQKDLQTQMEIIRAELEGERRARQLADDTTNASQKRMEELEAYKQQTSTEVELLKSELHLVQREAREQSVAAADALAMMNVLKAEKAEMESKYSEAVDGSNDRGQVLDSLRAAVAASATTAALMEQQLQNERGQREKVELLYNKLKSEHELLAVELAAATQRMQDAEALAERNAEEARTNRLAVMAGLDKVVASDTPRSGTADSESIRALQEQVKAANELARKFQQEVDAAADKLRGAEERIAGLEVYQEQSSRDGVSIRRQLQTALRDTQSLQAANSELKRELATQQLDTNAMSVQHATLKEILAERGISPTAASRSKGIVSPRAGSPEQARIRELEKQLAVASSSHEESRNSMMAALQASEVQYRDKLAQLEQDYNSAIAYLKTTEKMLKKLKEEHSAYKLENKRLRSEVEEHEERAASQSSKEVPVDWEAERNALQNQIETLQDEVRSTSDQLEARLQSVAADLASAKTERDGAAKSAEEAVRQLEANKKNLEQLQEENHLLEKRAQDAEQRVALLLDQVGTSVGNYRRQSRQILPGAGGTNGVSINVNHTRNESSDAGSVYEGSRGINARNSTALDSLANELETLRSHWEATNKSYRLSNAFDFDADGVGATPAKKGDDNAGLGLSESLADWRKRLDVDDRDSVEANHRAERS